MTSQRSIITATRTHVFRVLIGLGILLMVSQQSHAACKPNGMQLQILGSGGPGDSMGRASSAYVLWVEGESKILIDAGSGSKQTFHQAGASMGQVELVALSHLHPDHSAELPAILWPAGGTFILAGPSGDSVFPSITRFRELVFEAGGVYPVFGGRVDIHTIEIDPEQTSAVWQQEGLSVKSTGVPHGGVPTLAYRIDSDETSLVFASDQNGSRAEFIDFIGGVDTLVIHMSANEDATGMIAALHATPSVWGQMAESAGAGQVVVSHISTSDPVQLEANLEILRDNYSGKVVVAEDLMCIDLDENGD